MWQITELQTVDSTSNYVKSRLSELPDHTAVLAHEQTAGRGRLGRSFHSAAGVGLYLTALIKPRNFPISDAVYLTPATAVAVRNAIARFGVSADIKWVNDLHVNGKKLCGILVEPTFSGGYLTAAVIGIGVNIAHEVNSFPPELRDICTSLALNNASPLPSPRGLAETILSELDSALSLSPSELHTEYTVHCVTLNRSVEVSRLDGDGADVSTYPAHAVELTPRFELVVRHPDGRREEVSSGEVRVKNIC